MSTYPEKEKYDANDLICIVKLLRDPVSGCPWDKVQTHQSIRKNFLEETYEVLEAIDADDPAMLQEELGDVMMQVALHTCMETEKGHFTFTDVCDEVCRKLIYRHPHIFGGAAAGNTGINDWDALKNKEKGRAGIGDELATVPVTFPALMKAQKMQKRAEKYGASAQDARTAYGAVQKADTVLCNTLRMQQNENTEFSQHAAEEAAGQYLFAAADWLRCAGLDAEEALEKAAEKFRAANRG